MNSKNDECPLCGGNKTDGETTFTADFEFGVVVVRGVPASVCDQCGADWLEDRVAARELDPYTAAHDLLARALAPSPRP